MYLKWSKLMETWNNSLDRVRIDYTRVYWFTVLDFCAYHTLTCIYLFVLSQLQVLKKIMMTVEGTTLVVTSGMLKKRYWYQRRGSASFGIWHEIRENTQRRTQITGKKEFWNQEQPNDHTFACMMNELFTCLSFSHFIIIISLLLASFSDSLKTALNWEWSYTHSQLQSNYILLTLAFSLWTYQVFLKMFASSSPHFHWEVFCSVEVTILASILALGESQWSIHLPSYPIWCASL